MVAQHRELVLCRFLHQCARRDVYMVHPYLSTVKKIMYDMCSCHQHHHHQVKQIKWVNSKASWGHRAKAMGKNKKDNAFKENTTSRAGHA